MAYLKQWRLDHLAEARAKVLEHQRANPEMTRERQKRYRQADPEKIRKQDRERRLRLKLLVISAYGGRCACCGETEPEFLSIDHVNGGGTKHRKKVGFSGTVYRLCRDLGFPAEYQILCFNCNFSKSRGGVCVHKRASLDVLPSSPSWV